MSEYTIVLRDETVGGAGARVEIDGNTHALFLDVRDVKSNKKEFELALEVFDGKLRVLAWDADGERNPQGNLKVACDLTDWPVNGRD